MIKVYINYPVPHITIHNNLYCGNIQAQHKLKQRYIRINPATVKSELNNFREKKYGFAANQDYNDMWLEINFNDPEEEIRILQEICRLVGKYYRPLRGIEPIRHC